MSYVTYSCIPRYRVQYLQFLSALFNETVRSSEYIVVMNEWISLEVFSNDTQREEPRYAEKKTSIINPTWKCLEWKLVLRRKVWAMVMPNIFRTVWQILLKNCKSIFIFIAL